MILNLNNGSGDPADDPHAPFILTHMHRQMQLVFYWIRIDSAHKMMHTKLIAEFKQHVNTWSRN